MKPLSDLRATDRCVMCGLCLPHCPTYRETRDEGDSPRGRIALMQAMQSGSLVHSPRLAEHLERCLGCGACEAMCPARVPFGPLMDQARHTLYREKVRHRSLLRRFAADRLLLRPRALRATSRLLRLYQRSGLRTLLQRTGVLSVSGIKRFDRMLPDLPPVQHWQETYPATATERGRVALFLGCIARNVDTETIRCSISILNHLGYAVHIPGQQTCCGALHQHEGQLEHARQLALKNMKVFQECRPDAVISTASGCGAHLANYHRLAFEPQELREQSTDFAARVQDICSFLTQVSWPDTIHPAALAARVAVHEPCTLRNVLGQGAAPGRLLQRIPDIDLVSISQDGECCGSAGSYFLTQPELSGRLRERQIATLEEAQPDLITTSNVGCALQLKAGLRERGLDLEVIHPVALMARQLGL